MWQTCFRLTLALVIAAPALALAWSGPPNQGACGDPPCPPGGNVPAPLNVGSTDQVKNAGLSVNALAVFGSTAINGNTYLKTGVTGSIYRYLNFGVDYDAQGNVISNTTGSSGYGIRDMDGNIEFKNKGGSWASIQSTVQSLTGITSAVSTTTFSNGINIPSGCFAINGTCIGAVARSWVNVSSSRVIGATYTNSTGHDIEVSATTWGTNRCAAGIYINGGPIYVGYNYKNNSTGNAACNASATIPNGATYRLSNDGAADIQLLSWYELR